MHELLTTPPQAALIVLRTLVVYAFILVALRISGKREVGQFAPFDFALILLIANSVQNAMVGSDTSLAGGLVAAFVLLVVDMALSRLGARSRKLERLLRGHARILVNRGHIYEQALRAENVSHEEVMQALRASGCATLADCRLAVLEVDGHISVIEQRGEQPRAEPPGAGG
jgi:uncharacterized membrane protein YcaP (DUF421 family)